MSGCNSPLSTRGLFMNPLIKRLGTRKVAVAGGLVSGLCVMSTSLTSSVYLMGFFFLTAGFFSSASNLCTAITLQQHFGSRFGAVNSFALIGLSAGSTLLPIMTSELYICYGISGALLLLGAILLHEFPIGALMVPAGDKDRMVRLYYSEESPNDDDDKHIPRKCGGGEKENTSDAEAGLIYKHTRGQSLGVASGGAPQKCTNNYTFCSRCMEAIKNIFDFHVLYEEKHFTALMLPILILSSMSNYGWVLFVTSYAISVGADTFQAACLAAVGAAGGIVSCVVQAIVFNKRPQWSPHLMTTLCLTGSLTLLIQTMRASLTYLLVCSFIIGASLYGISVVVDAVVAVIVAPSNFQSAIAFTFALEGIGTLIAGPFSGFLFDSTGSFETVFRVLAGMAGLAHTLGVLLILTLRYRTRD